MPNPPRLGAVPSGSRRRFLKTAAAGVAGAGALMGGSRAADAGALPVPHANGRRFVGGKFPRGPVMARGRVLGANDRIGVAHIGVGNMGTAQVEEMKKHGAEWNAQSIAFSDVYDARLERARSVALGADLESRPIQAERDYRRVLENKDVDAVVIATPEHWHCQIAVHALEAGKHVYVQKPMARYLDEAFQLHDAWKRSGKTVQIGSQGTTDPKYHVAREVIASGKLGALVSAQSSYTRNPKDGEWNTPIEEGAGPANLDWEMWLGSTPKRAWNADSRERFFRYRKFRDYSAGILGDLLPHRIHPLLFALGGRSWPLRVSCLGTRNVSTDREVPDTVHVTAEMEGGWTFLFVGSTVNEQGVTEQVRGHRSTLYLGGKEPDLKPERPFAEEIDAAVLPVIGSGDPNWRHVQNWLESMRAGKQPNCDMELGMRAQALISLAEISERSRRTVEFDPARRSWKLA